MKTTNLLTVFVHLFFSFLSNVSLSHQQQIENVKIEKQAKKKVARKRFNGIHGIHLSSESFQHFISNHFQSAYHVQLFFSPIFFFLEFLDKRISCFEHKIERKKNIKMTNGIFEMWIIGYPGGYQWKPNKDTQKNFIKKREKWKKEKKRRKMFIQYFSWLASIDKWLAFETNFYFRAQSLVTVLLSKRHSIRFFFLCSVPSLLNTISHIFPNATNLCPPNR